MTQRQCPECGSELMLARRPNNQQRLGIVAIALLTGAEAFAEARSPRNNYAKWKRAKQLDNSTA
jgi:hypothetical protein